MEIILNVAAKVAQQKCVSVAIINHNRLATLSVDVLHITIDWVWGPTMAFAIIYCVGCLPIAIVDRNRFCELYYLSMTISFNVGPTLFIYVFIDANNIGRPTTVPINSLRHPQNHSGAWFHVLGSTYSYVEIVQWWISMAIDTDSRLV